MPGSKDLFDAAEVRCAVAEIELPECAIGGLYSYALELPGQRQGHKGLGPALSRTHRSIAARLEFGTVAAGTGQARLKVFASGSNRLRRRPSACFDPLHQAIEGGCDLRRALACVLVLISVGLHQPIAARGRLGEIAVEGFRVDRD